MHVVITMKLGSTYQPWTLIAPSNGRISLYCSIIMLDIYMNKQLIIWNVRYTHTPIDERS